MLLSEVRPNWIVVYRDGQKSKRMDRSAALGFASVYGGRLVRVEPGFSALRRLVKRLREL